MTVYDTREARRSCLKDEIRGVEILSQDDYYEYSDFTCNWNGDVLCFRVCGLDGNFTVYER